MKRKLLRAAAFVVATTWAIACADSGKGTGPDVPTPTRISLSHTVVNLNDGASTGVRATVYDQNDQPMPDQEVTWSSADPTIATVDKGTVTAQRPGTTEITATAGNASAKATVNVAPVATTLQMIRGDEQEGLPGAVLADSLVVRVLDRHGNGVPGVSVRFVVTTGEGSVSPANATTNAEGYAAAEWQLGITSAVTQTVEARADNLDGSPIEFSAKIALEEPATVAIGDTIMGLISQEGEVDTFTFTGAAGQEINIFLQPLPWSNGLKLELYQHYGTANETLLREFTAFPWNDLDLNANQTRRLALPDDGTYTIVIKGSESLYRLVIFPIDRGPEGLRPGGEVEIGELVTGGSIYPYGDIDTYTFTGTAGQEINVFFQEENRNSSLRMEVYRGYGTPSQERIATAFDAFIVGQNLSHTGRFALPEDGTYTIVIDGDEYNSVGTYRFQIIPIDRRPESIAATVAIGDTIDGESLDPLGDVDEFTFTGVGGQVIDIYFQPYGHDHRFMLAVYDRYGTPEQTELSHVYAFGTDNLEKYGISGLTLPRDGVYTIVVEEGDEPYQTGAYRFHIRPRN